MYRDLGHGTMESRLESVMEELKTLLVGPAQKPTMELLLDRLNPEKDHLQPH